MPSRPMWRGVRTGQFPQLQNIAAGARPAPMQDALQRYVTRVNEARTAPAPGVRQLAPQMAQAARGMGVSLAGGIANRAFDMGDQMIGQARGMLPANADPRIGQNLDAASGRLAAGRQRYNTAFPPSGTTPATPAMPGQAPAIPARPGMGPVQQLAQRFRTSDPRAQMRQLLRRTFSG